MNYQKDTEKLGRQRWTMVYVANTAVLTFRFISGIYHFRLWVLASTGEYFYC